jgi:hypothetical protein
MYILKLIRNVFIFFAYRYALYGPMTRLIIIYLANVKTSDEMLLPTILMVLL